MDITQWSSRSDHAAHVHHTYSAQPHWQVSPQLPRRKLPTSSIPNINGQRATACIIAGSKVLRYLLAHPMMADHRFVRSYSCSATHYEDSQLVLACKTCGQPLSTMTVSGCKAAGLRPQQLEGACGHSNGQTFYRSNAELVQSGAMTAA